MFTRLVSLVLVAAVIACPMWCGNGVCHADQCCIADECGSEEQSSACCPLHAAADCCTGNVAQEHDEDAPGRCPNESACQGVCGGAVFEKSCELNGPDGSFFLPTIGHDGSTVSLLSHFRIVGVQHHPCISAKNHGRFVRTLHSSFLC